MYSIKKLVLILMVLLVLGFTVPMVVAQVSSQRTVFQNLVNIGDFSTATSAIRAAGLDGALQGTTPYTLFAPNNAAFNKIPKESLGALVKDQAKVGDLLKYHVVPGKLTYSDLSKMTEVKTVGGATLPIGFKNGVMTVGGARVLNQGIDSSNGIIYPIDSVLVPPGFAMPQVSRSTGLPLGWMAALIGAIALGALALYLVRRGKHKYEMPRGRYEEPRMRTEERPMAEETRRAEETMKHVRESVSAVHEPSVADIAKNIDLPLSGDALKGLNMLTGNGTFKDKPDFLSFLAKTFMQNNLGAAMSGGKEPGLSMIMDIIDKTGIAKGFAEGDVKQYLVPLLMTGFMAVYNYLNRKPAVKVA